MSAFAKLLSRKAKKPAGSHQQPAAQDIQAVQKQINTLVQRRSTGEDLRLLAPEVEKLLYAASEHESIWDVITAERETSACYLLDMFQAWLDGAPEHDLRKNAIYLIVKLADRSKEMPPTLFLRGVSLQSPYPRFSGGGGDVYVGSLPQGHAIAVKRPRLASDSQKAAWFKTFTREALIWRQLNHPNILRFYGIDAKTFRESSLLGLVTPWAKNGCLDDFITKSEYNPQNHRERFLKGIASGLSYLHSLAITHGDIKGANVLIDDSKNAVLADFGLIVIGENTPGRPTTISGQYGTPDYAAPERLGGQISRSNPPVDVYAFACVCLRLWTHKPLWPRYSSEQIEAAVIKGHRPPRPKTCVGTPMTDDMWHLIEQCWEQDPKKRAKIEHALSYFDRDGTTDQKYMFLAKSIGAYNARNQKELSVTRDELFEVESPQGTFWTVVNSAGQRGSVPEHVFPDPSMFIATAKEACSATSDRRMLAYAKQEELSILYINGGWWMAKNKLGKLGMVQAHNFDLIQGWCKTSEKTAWRLRYDHFPSGVSFALQLPRGTAVAVKRVFGEWTVARTVDKRVGLVRTSYLGPTN